MNHLKSYTLKGVLFRAFTLMFERLFRDVSHLLDFMSDLRFKVLSLALGEPFHIFWKELVRCPRGSLFKGESKENAP